MGEEMIVKNRDELETSEFRGMALSILEEGVKAVLPESVVSDSLDVSKDKLTVVGDISGECSAYECFFKGRVFVIGFGKASERMARCVEDKFEKAGIFEKLEGLVVCKEKKNLTRKIRVLEGSHPVPDERSVSAAEIILDFKRINSVGEDDLVLFLISGGGSSLISLPREGITLEDLKRTTSLLLKSGADIHEINSVRKHLSRIKGGLLAKHFKPSTCLSLMISDVMGNDLSVIASGPTSPDGSTFKDAFLVLKKYGLLDKVPASVVELLDRGCDGVFEETPSSESELGNVKNFIIADNKTAVDAMVKKAKAMDLDPFVISELVVGETNAAAKKDAKLFIAKVNEGFDVVVGGGETTPMLPENHGVGGRNQQYALVSAVELRKKCKERWVVLSVGSDGSDFLKDYAGAMLESDDNLEGAVEYLERYDACTFLKDKNSLVVTGDTGTNVGDLMIYLNCKKP